MHKLGGTLIICTALGFPAAAVAVIVSPTAQVVTMAGSLRQVQGIDQLQGSFSCAGSPDCIGTAVIAAKDSGCANTHTFQAVLTLSGFGVDPIAPPQGTFTMDRWYTHANNADGSCTYSQTAGRSFSWTGSYQFFSGTLAFGDNSVLPPRTIAGVFTSNFCAFCIASPVVTVDSAVITASTVDLQTTVYPDPDDIGRVGSVYVFAHAPSSLVSGLKREQDPRLAGRAADDSVMCILAQVNASGQLIAVDASTMQPFVTGVLTAAGQSVHALNNAATNAISGVTVFAGSGANAAAMLDKGTFGSAISVPGLVQCTANLGAPPAPATPGPLTGIWWNASESGWGVHITQRGSNKFAAWYTYDAAGKPKWYVSTCAGAGGTAGTCRGALYEVTGPNFFGGAFNPSLVNSANAGNLQMTFSNAGSGSMTYTGVAGQTRAVALTRQPLASGITPPAVDYTDLWWNPRESGWGMAMTQQYGVAFLAWYVYDANGKPTWLVSTCNMSGSSCSGKLLRTTGPAFGPSFDSSRVQSVEVGGMTVSFIDANNALLSYTVDGVSANKTVTRQLF